MTASERRAPLVLAAGVFLFVWLRPLYAAHLRRQAAAQAPEVWAREPMNGRFAVLLPELMGTRYHDEAMYAARVHQILLHGRPYNPYLRQERGPRSWLHQSLAMYVMALFGRLCGGDLNRGWILAAATLAALWFLLFYAAFAWWSGSAQAAGVLALFSILFPDVYFWLLDVNFNPSVLWHRWLDVFFQHGDGIRPNFYRLPSNFLSLFLLALLLLGLWRLLCTGRPAPLKAIALGAGFGALALVHAYSHVFGLAVLTVLTALVWWRKDPPQAKAALGVTLAAALAVTAGYAALMSWAIDAESRAYALKLSGWMPSRHFYLVTLIHPLFAAFGFWKLSLETSAEKRWAWLVLSASQLAVFGCRNGQVLAGAMIQPFHFIPLGSFTGALMLTLPLSQALAGQRWFDRRATRAAGLAVVLLALVNEKSAAERTFRLLGLPRDVQGALDWVAREVPRDGLVVSLSAEANKTIPLYTQAKVAVSPPDPNVSSPFTPDEYFGSVARLLKTCEADPARFLEDRWLLSGPKNELLRRIGREEFSLARADRDLLEPAMWFYPQYAWDASDAPIVAGRRRIAELYRSAAKLDPPFVLWVDKKDERYLGRSPEALGGRLVYENPEIRLYAFKP